MVKASYRISRACLSKMLIYYFGRKLVVSQAFGRCPFYGEFGTGMCGVSIVAHQTCQSKVGYLD